MKWIFGALFLLGTYTIQAQAINESVESSVYDFLYRNAQKGNIELFDMVRPLTRNQIANYLSQINTKFSKDPSSLNRVEKKELHFYWQEYGFGLTEGVKNNNDEKWIGKDARGRYRFFASIQSDSVSKSVTGKPKKVQPFQFDVQPILQGFFNYAKDSENYIRRATGVQLWASLGKRWGFQAYYRDITEDGDGIDKTKQYTPDPGLVLATTSHKKSVNYSDVRASVNYEWNSGILSVGKEQYVAGYGLNGNIIRSTKAPSYPYIRVKQRILRWLQFEYMHSILASNIIDTPNSYQTVNYGVYGGERFKMIPKYLVSHAVDIRIAKGLQFMAGESVIYTDKIQAGYWLPLMFFKAWDQYIAGNNINAGSNTQLFFQLSSRNQLPHTHLYASLFVDEIRPTVILNEAKSRNQIAFNVGASLTDLPFLPYVTFNVDYTRVNPFVYKNLQPAQEYNSNGYLLGDWMGPNSDRYLMEIKYSPIPRLRLSFREERIRKGSEGNAYQQYLQSPQPKFLNGLQYKQWTLSGKAVYEWKHNVYFQAEYYRRDKYLYSGTFANIYLDRIRAGVMVGL